jgi:type IV secretion system protein VirB10
MSDTATPPADEADIRPLVRTAAPGNLGLWLFGVALLLGGYLVFCALSDSREAQLAATGLPVAQDGAPISAPPPLALPPGYADALADETRRLPVRYPAATPPAPPQLLPQTRIVERPVPIAMSPAEPLPAPVLTPRVPIVIEPPRAAERLAPALTEHGSDRVTASRLLNPSLTVPQGVVIAAVLETALDSTRPGGVRAIVSRDVRSFDGSRVLIPRGSRLYGEYQADVTAGQKRALVRWRRLTRPDAVVIDLDSPAADPLGRAGVEGKVDSHFLARFGGAILQSVLDIGVGLATRSVTDDAVILALPGSTQQITGQQSSQVQPTLRVRQGTSVSVFVARDLDFSTVDR